MFRNAQDLRCGNVFEFKRAIYIVLSSFTDKRHTQSIITAVEESSMDDGIASVVVFRFFRTCKVDVVDTQNKYKLLLSVIENERSDLTEDDLSELERMRSLR